MSRRLTTAEFIDKAKAVHGDRYDYSLAKYTKAHEKVVIICPDHGAFLQTPASHTSGKGCKECGRLATTEAHRRSTADFVKEAVVVHGDRYDYSHVDYVDAHTKVTIKCPDHGPFTQTPNNHLNGQGCRNCSYIDRGSARRLTKKEFIRAAIRVHRNHYDYSQVEYVNSATPVTIVCPDHGAFHQRPNSHLSGKGCKKCGRLSTSEAQRYSNENFVDKAKAVHGDWYDYSQVQYKRTHDKVRIICPVHGPFDQVPSAHLRGVGCSDCADSGFNPNSRATLYYLAITSDEGNSRYKIGITNRTVEERYRAPDLARIRIVKTWHYAVGRAAAAREAEILRQYAGDRYYGPDILLSGNTELFTHDILGLDADFDTES